MKTIIILLINIYQKTLSPDHGIFRARYPYGFCRFYPSCSEYAKQAVVKKGFVIGMLMSVKRIIKCNPFAKPEVDPVV